VESINNTKPPILLNILTTEYLIELGIDELDHSK